MNIFKNKNCKINTILNNNIIKQIDNDELNKYQIMHELIESNLSKYLNYFRHGDYNNLNIEFTNEEYIRFGLLLENNNIFNKSNIEKYKYKLSTFDSYRNSFHRILDGFKISINNNNKITILIKEINNINSIINDPNKLLDYYNKNYKNIYTINNLNVSTELIPIKIKEEYLIYIKRYGNPKNGNFDSEKISSILLELQASNKDTCL